MIRMNIRKVKKMSTIAECSDNFLGAIRDARAENTYRTYDFAIKKFMASLLKAKLDPQTSSVDLLTEDHLKRFITSLNDFSPGTEGVCIVAVKNFYKFLGAENVRVFNYPRIENIIHFRKRKPQVRLPQFPEEDIAEFIERIDEIVLEQVFETENEKLRAYRDRAFLLMLADTGFRVGEACSLLIGSINWKRKIAVVIGKNREEAVVRFSPRCIRALREYLDVREQNDSKRGTQRASLPLFLRHDQGASKRKFKSMSTSAPRKTIIKDRMYEVLKRHPSVKVTPHSFRHYYATKIYKQTGNLVQTQGLMRHKQIANTRIYTHLDDRDLDETYRDVFGD